MSRITSLLRSQTSILALIALSSALHVGDPAQAALIEVDLNAPGDALVTRDTISALDWLDLTESDGFSYVQIRSGQGGFSQDGWRHATTGEVCGFLGQISSLSPATCPGGITYGTDPSQIDPFTELLGQTTTNGTFGVYDDGRNSVLTGRAVVGLSTSSLPFIWIRNRTQGTTSPAPHFLVRPIPEPGTALLVGLGLAFLSVSTFNRHRVF